MSRRIHLNVDRDSPLHDERYEREPRIPDCIKIDDRRMQYFHEYGQEAGIDGDHLVSLVSGADPPDMMPQWEHEIEAGDDVREIVGLLTELMEGLEENIDSDYNPVELKFEDDTPYPKEELTETDYERHRAYLKARQIRDLGEFALEHDKGLYVG